MLRKRGEEATGSLAPASVKRATGARNRLRLAAGGLLVAAIVAILVGWTSLGGAPAETADTGRVLAVPVIAAQAVDGYEVVREFVGKVEADRDSSLSFELDGKLVAVETDEGHTVRRGDVIGRLDTARLERRREVLEARSASAKARLDEFLEGPRKEVIAAARAELTRLRAQKRLAERNAGRARKLIGRSAISQEELDDDVLTLAAADAQHAAQQARLDELLAGTRSEQIDAQQALVREIEAEVRSIDVDLEKSTLYAPFDGTIGRRYVDEGEVVAAGMPIVDLIETGRPRVRVGLTPRAAGAIRENDQLTLSIEGQKHTARAVAKRPDRDRSTRTVTVVFDLDANPASVRMGDLAVLELERTISAPGFWLPTSALTEGARGLWACYVAMPLEKPAASGATHVLSRRPLELIYSDTDRGFVQGALEPADLVVSGGLQRLVPDQRVRLGPQEAER